MKNASKTTCLVSTQLPFYLHCICLDSEIKVEAVFLSVIVRIVTVVLSAT